MSRNFEETTLLVIASANIPNLKLLSFPGSQFSSTCLLLVEFSTFEVIQLKISKLHFVPFIEAASCFLHFVFQHVVCRSMDSRYHDAPRTYIHERSTGILKFGNCIRWKPQLVSSHIIPRSYTYIRTFLRISKDMD